MWLDTASENAVDLFWQLCGELEPFPRSLERSTALALPVTLVKLPKLKLRGVESWLQRRRVSFQFDCQSRAVRGCLIAFGGEGLVFVDGADPDDQRRFTVAHEIAHFIMDYWLPRNKAVKKLGDEITEVLDGIRVPTVSERLHALLVNAPIGIYTDLMERRNARSEVWKVENRADKIALALLAPPEAVLAKTDISAARFHQRQVAITTVLCEHFGLPTTIGGSYGRSLLIASDKGPSWLETIRPR